MPSKLIRVFPRGMIHDPGIEYDLMWCVGAEGDKYYLHIRNAGCVEMGCVSLTHEEVNDLIFSQRYAEWWALKPENLTRCINLYDEV